MGVVYEAEQISLGRRVALKVLARHVAADRRALERFRLEAKSAARLHHTNIVPVFEVGQERNVAFSMMGGAQPVGFGIGLVLGGVFAGTSGWQWGFFFASIINFAMLVLSAWQLPSTVQAHKERILSRLASDIDWLGLVLASGFLAMLSYVIA